MASATHPHLAPYRPAVGIAPRISDAELICLAIMETLLDFTSERRFIRYAHKHLASIFPYIPQQSGYNKRQRALTTLIQHIMSHLSTSTGLLHDDRWVVDSTPIECGRSLGHRATLPTGRIRRIRLLRFPLPVIFGACACT